MPDDNIPSKKYRDTGIPPYFVTSYQLWKTSPNIARMVGRSKDIGTAGRHITASFVSSNNVDEQRRCGNTVGSGHAVVSYLQKSMSKGE